MKVVEVRAASGSLTFDDNRRFVRIARGSFNETKHWLRRAYKRRLLTESQITKLTPMINDLGPTLNAYLRSIGQSPSTHDAAG
ncbi:MAG: four helix bundle protein [Acidobacteria bacterium]|nr:four helix bundle protein [Acidobacteriota bacterium]